MIQRLRAWIADRRAERRALAEYRTAWRRLARLRGASGRLKQYAQTDLEADREVANTLAARVIGGLLVTGIDDQLDGHDGETAWSALANPLADYWPSVMLGS